MDFNLIETINRATYCVIMLGIMIIFILLICFYLIISMDNKINKMQSYFAILLKDKLKESNKLNFPFNGPTTIFKKNKDQLR